jgi:hypothetical protein
VCLVGSCAQLLGGLSQFLADLAIFLLIQTIVLALLALVFGRSALAFGHTALVLRCLSPTLHVAVSRGILLVCIRTVPLVSIRDGSHTETRRPIPCRCP